MEQDHSEGHSDNQQDVFDGEEYEYRDPDQMDGSQQQQEQENLEGDQHNIDYYRDNSKRNHQQQSNASPRLRDASEQLNTSFERDSNNLMKVKANITHNINQERQKNGLPEMYEDITLCTIAMQFASHLKNNEFDKNQLNRLKDAEKNDIEFKISYIKSEYQQDAQITKQFTINYFIQMGYLFFEIDQDRKILLDQTYNHIGIGIAGNDTHIVVVLLMAQRDIAMTQVVDKGSGLVQIKGKMLDHTIGICGVKVYNRESFDKIKKGNEKQQPEAIASALFDKIDFNRLTKQFCIYLDITPNWKQKRWIELLTRENPDAIPYRKPRKDKDKQKNFFKHLKPKLRSLFIEYPDKQYVYYYEQLNQLKKKKNQDILQSVKKQQEEKIRLQLQLKNQQSSIVQPQQSQKLSDEQSDEEQPIKEQNKQGIVSNKQIRQELQQAITEAKTTYQTLLFQNRELQEKIKEIKYKSESSYTDKNTEMTMNQHKYLNTLTQVHQTRVDLQTTQDRYNRMSIQLQNKLNQKQLKCNEIRLAFQQLKRQVSKKAAYSRSDLPIRANKIDEWEQRQKKLAQELQTLRLQILRARNTLSKNQKILKKKEQLAEGLHLIDFQQLKIQNQTLNEKIEERNEDLHKLKKKTTTIVQILTHTREKLGFVTAFKNQLEKKSNVLDTKVKHLRNEISDKKLLCQIQKEEIQKAKQQTEIVNSQQLVVDFKKRTQNIQQLQQQIKDLQNQQKQMKTVIENYQRKMRKQVIKK